MKCSTGVCVFRLIFAFTEDVVDKVCVFFYNKPMHEVGVAEEIIKTAIKVAKENKAEIPLKVGLSVGTLSGVEPSSLEFALEAIKVELGLADTIFDIEVVKAAGICGVCGKNSEPDALFAICEHCGSPALELTAGTEFKILYIDI